ncbi:MAG: hypothetical protein QOI22_1859 [Verrucomicrobiota bacterium]
MFAQKGGENLLANRFAHSKANKDFKPSKAVPKKSKIVQDENSRSIVDGSSLPQSKIDKKPSRLRSISKTKPTAKKKTSAKAKTAKSSKAIEPSDEEIRIRAYFVAERRQRLDLPGDANTDWLEAKRQLSEIGPR